MKSVKTLDTSTPGRSLTDAIETEFVALPREYENRDSSHTVGSASSALPTFPILVIGFSGSIVLCGFLFFLAEIRERRKLQDQMMTLVQSLSVSKGSIRSESGRLSTKSFRVLQEQVEGFRNDSLSSPRNLHDSIHICATPEEYEANGPFLSCKDDNIYPDVLLYRSDHFSVSDTSTMTTSLPLEDDDENFTQNTVVLTEMHRVSEDTKLASLVDSGQVSADVSASMSNSTAGHTSRDHSRKAIDEIRENEDPNRSAIESDLTSTIPSILVVSNYDAGLLPIADVMFDGNDLDSHSEQTHGDDVSDRDATEVSSFRDCTWSTNSSVLAVDFGGDVLSPNRNDEHRKSSLSILLLEEGTLVSRGEGDDSTKLESLSGRSENDPFDERETEDRDDKESGVFSSLTCRKSSCSLTSDCDSDFAERKGEYDSTRSSLASF